MVPLKRPFNKGVGRRWLGNGTKDVDLLSGIGKYTQ